MAYNWDFGIILLDRGLWLNAILGTLGMVGAAIAIGLPLGLLWTALRIYAPRPVQVLTIAIIEFLRVLPPIVVIIWVYFALPMLTGLNLTAFAAGALAVGVQGSAYLSEAVRAGINAIDRGQSEAAKAIGMRNLQIMRLIILPQALRPMVPVMISLLAEVVKATSLVAMIGFGEISYAASRAAADTYRPVEAYTVAAVLYFILIFGLSRFAIWIEGRASKGQRA